MGLRESKKEQQKNDLLDVAEKMFRERGFDATTMEEIAVRSNVSRQTLVNYFRTKDVLLREVGARWLRHTIGSSQARKQSALAEGPLEAIRKGIRTTARAIQEDSDFMLLVYTRSGIFFPQGRIPDTEDPQTKLTKKGFEAYAELYRQAQDMGEIRAEADPLQLAEMTFAVQSVTTRLWLTNYWQKRQKLETRLVAAFDLLLTGFGRTKTSQRD